MGATRAQGIAMYFRCMDSVVDAGLNRKRHVVRVHVTRYLVSSVPHVAAIE